MPIEANLDGFEPDKQVLFMNAVDVLRLRKGALTEFPVKAGQYVNLGKVYVGQEAARGLAARSRLCREYVRELENLGIAGPSFEEACERDGMICVVATYELHFQAGNITMRIKAFEDLPEDEFLIVGQDGGLVPAVNNRRPRQAMLDGKTYPVLQVNPYQAEAIFRGVLGGIGAEEDEFPTEGGVLLMVVPFESEEERKNTRAELKEMALARGRNLRFPGPTVYRNFYDLVVGYAVYRLERDEEGSCFIGIQEANRVEPHVIADGGELVPLVLEDVD